MADKDNIDLPKEEWDNYEEGIFRDPREVGPDALPGYPTTAGWDWWEEHGGGPWSEEYQTELAQRYAEEKARRNWEEALDRVTAEIGNLTFKDEFSNPDVDLTHERQTAEHEVVSGYNEKGNSIEFVVQTMGRKPPEIKITGWVTEEQLETADKLVSKPFVEVVTDRWTGTAVATNVSSPYNRTYHDKYGRIFEVTIDLLGVEQSTLPDEESSENSVLEEIQDNNRYDYDGEYGFDS